MKGNIKAQNKAMKQYNKIQSRNNKIEKKRLAKLGKDVKGIATKYI